MATIVDYPVGRLQPRRAAPIPLPSCVPLPMQSILETVLPIFGLVLCGYVVGRKGWMSEEAIKGLNTFVFYFAIPALLFRATAGGLELVELSIKIGRASCRERVCQYV